MTAIRTMYRGVLFRSRLEARWAEAFDRIGVVWEFEPEGVELADGSRYLPDFWLPLICSRGKPAGVYFEVKPSSPSEGERHKARLLAWKTRIPVIVVARNPGGGLLESFEEFVGGETGWHDEDLTLARCSNCGQVDIGYHTRKATPCPCGNGPFNLLGNPALDTMRIEFPNLQRWEPAA